MEGPPGPPIPPRPGGGGGGSRQRHRRRSRKSTASKSTAGRPAPPTAATPAPKTPGVEETPGEEETPLLPRRLLAEEDGAGDSAAISADMAAMDADALQRAGAATPAPETPGAETQGTTKKRRKRRKKKKGGDTPGCLIPPTAEASAPKSTAGAKSATGVPVPPKKAAAPALKASTEGATKKKVPALADEKNGAAVGALTAETKKTGNEDPRLRTTDGQQQNDAPQALLGDGHGGVVEGKTGDGKAKPKDTPPQKKAGLKSPRGLVAKKAGEKAGVQPKAHVRETSPGQHGKAKRTSKSTSKNPKEAGEKAGERPKARGQHAKAKRTSKNPTDAPPQKKAGLKSPPEKAGLKSPPEGSMPGRESSRRSAAASGDPKPPPEEMAVTPPNPRPGALRWSTDTDEWELSPDFAPDFITAALVAYADEERSLAGYEDVPGANVRAEATPGAATAAQEMHAKAPARTPGERAAVTDAPRTAPPKTPAPAKSGAKKGAGGAPPSSGKGSGSRRRGRGGGRSRGTKTPVPCKKKGDDAGGTALAAAFAAEGGAVGGEPGDDATDATGLVDPLGPRPRGAEEEAFGRPSAGSAAFFHNAEAASPAPAPPGAAGPPPQPPRDPNSPGGMPRSAQPKTPADGGATKGGDGAHPSSKGGRRRRGSRAAAKEEKKEDDAGELEEARMRLAELEEALPQLEAWAARETDMRDRLLKDVSVMVKRVAVLCGGVPFILRYSDEIGPVLVSKIHEIISIHENWPNDIGGATPLGEAARRISAGIAYLRRLKKLLSAILPARGEGEEDEAGQQLRGAVAENPTTGEQPAAASDSNSNDPTKKAGALPLQQLALRALKKTIAENVKEDPIVDAEEDVDVGDGGGDVHVGDESAASTVVPGEGEEDEEAPAGEGQELGADVENPITDEQRAADVERNSDGNSNSDRPEKAATSINDKKEEVAIDAPTGDTDGASAPVKKGDASQKASKKAEERRLSSSKLGKLQALAKKAAKGEEDGAKSKVIKAATAVNGRLRTGMQVEADARRSTEENPARASGADAAPANLNVAGGDAPHKNAKDPIADVYVSLQNVDKSGGAFDAAGRAKGPESVVGVEGGLDAGVKATTLAKPGSVAGDTSIRTCVESSAPTSPAPEGSASKTPVPKTSDEGAKDDTDVPEGAGEKVPIEALAGEGLQLPGALAANPTTDEQRLERNSDSNSGSNRTEEAAASNNDKKEVTIDVPNVDSGGGGKSFSSNTPAKGNASKKVDGPRGDEDAVEETPYKKTNRTNEPSPLSSLRETLATEQADGADKEREAAKLWSESSSLQKENRGEQKKTLTRQKKAAVIRRSIGGDLPARLFVRDPSSGDADDAATTLVAGAAEGAESIASSPSTPKGNVDLLNGGGDVDSGEEMENGDDADPSLVAATERTEFVAHKLDAPVDDVDGGAVTTPAKPGATADGTHSGVVAKSGAPTSPVGSPGSAQAGSAEPLKSDEGAKEDTEKGFVNEESDESAKVRITRGKVDVEAETPEPKKSDEGAEDGGDVSLQDVDKSGDTVDAASLDVLASNDASVNKEGLDADFGLEDASVDVVEEEKKEEAGDDAPAAALVAEGNAVGGKEGGAPTVARPAAAAGADVLENVLPNDDVEWGNGGDLDVDSDEESEATAADVDLEGVKTPTKRGAVASGTRSAPTSPAASPADSPRLAADVDLEGVKTPTKRGAVASGTRSAPTSPAASPADGPRLVPAKPPHMESGEGAKEDTGVEEGAIGTQATVDSAAGAGKGPDDGEDEDALAPRAQAVVPVSKAACEGIWENGFVNVIIHAVEEGAGGGAVQLDCLKEAEMKITSSMQELFVKIPKYKDVPISVAARSAQKAIDVTTSKESINLDFEKLVHRASHALAGIRVTRLWGVLDLLMTKTGMTEEMALKMLAPFKAMLGPGDSVDLKTVSLAVFLWKMLIPALRPSAPEKISKEAHKMVNTLDERVTKKGNDRAFTFTESTFLDKVLGDVSIAVMKRMLSNEAVDGDDNCALPSFFLENCRQADNRKKRSFRILVAGPLAHSSGRILAERGQLGEEDAKSIASALLRGSMSVYDGIECRQFLLLLLEKNEVKRGRVSNVKQAKGRKGKAKGKAKGEKKLTPAEFVRKILAKGSAKDSSQPADEQAQPVAQPRAEAEQRGEE